MRPRRVRKGDFWESELFAKDALTELILCFAFTAIEVAVVENGAIPGGGVLAGGGGATLALASDNTNVLLSSTRMEALGLAPGISYARNWVGNW
jgi:hypothetical protein